MAYNDDQSPNPNTVKNTKQPKRTVYTIDKPITAQDFPDNAKTLKEKMKGMNKETKRRFMELFNTLYVDE
jgi:hypothetical protein